MQVVSRASLSVKKLMPSDLIRAKQFKSGGGKFISTSLGRISFGMP